MSLSVIAPLRSGRALPVGYETIGVSVGKSLCFFPRRAAVTNRARGLDDEQRRPILAPASDFSACLENAILEALREYG